MSLVPIVSKTLHIKYELNTTENKGVIKVWIWLPWQPGYHSNEVPYRCLLSQRPSMPNLKSVGLKAKELLGFHSGCHDMKISLVSNRNVASAARDLVATSKKPLPFTNCFVVLLHKHRFQTETWMRAILTGYLWYKGQLTYRSTKAYRLFFSFFSQQRIASNTPAQGALAGGETAVYSNSRTAMCYVRVLAESYAPLRHFLFVALWFQTPLFLFVSLFPVIRTQ